MDKIMYSLQLEQSLKEQAEQTFAGIGLNLSEAINVFLRKAIMEHGLPFDVHTVSYSAELLEAIQETEQIIAEYDANIRLPRSFASANEMTKAMDEEDAAEGLV